MPPKKISASALKNANINIPKSRITVKKAKGGAIDFTNLKISELYPLSCIVSIVILYIFYSLPFLSFFAKPFLEIPYNIPLPSTNSTIIPGPTYETGFFDLTFFVFIYLLVVIIGSLLNEIFIMFAKNFWHSSKKDQLSFSRSTTDIIFFSLMLLWGSSLFKGLKNVELIHMPISSYLANEKLFLIVEAAYFFKILMDYLVLARENESKMNYIFISGNFVSTIACLTALLTKTFFPSLLLISFYNIALVLSSCFSVLIAAFPKQNFSRFKPINLLIWVALRIVVPLCVCVFFIIKHFNSTPEEPTNSNENENEQIDNQQFPILLYILFTIAIVAFQTLWILKKTKVKKN